MSITSAREMPFAREELAQMGGQNVDQQLVERVQHGDKSAFDVLVLKYQHKIVKLISRYVRDQS